MSRISGNQKRKIWRRILVGLLLFISLAVLSTAILLKRGIGIDVFTVGAATVSDFSLQWRDKLEIQIEVVTIASQNDSEFTRNFSLISKTIRTAKFLDNFCSKLSIKTIRAGELNGTLHLDASVEPSFFILASNDLVFRSILILKDNSLVIDVEELSSKRFNSRVSGQIHLEGGEEKITGTLSANLAGVLPVTLDFTADREQISFSGKEAGVINDITPFVDLFGLDNNIQRWITEYLQGSRYHLTSFKGAIPWHKPEAVLDTLYAEVKVDDFEYTFAPGNPGLQPVKADYTDLLFNNKILTIIPHEPLFHEQGVGDSHVNIDFTDPADIILTVTIKTFARADDDILTLLNHYHIPLPFKQTAGKTKTDFTLAINLNKQQVSTSGTFLIDEGIIEFGGKNYSVTDTSIVLENSNISINGVISFEKLFVAGINGTFETAAGTGDINITLEQIKFKAGESDLTLGESKTKPVIQYHIRPDGHSVNVSSSSWALDSLQLTLGPFSSPFSPKKLSIDFPPTLLTILPGVSSKISGSFSFKEKKAAFHCDLLKYQVRDLTLESSSVPFFIQYDQDLTIRTEKTSHWMVNNILTTLYPSEFKYGDNVLSITNGRIIYGDFFDSQISGHYNSLSRQGGFILEDLHLKEKNIGHLLDLPDGISVEVSGKNDRLVINVPELDLMISTDENKGWSATFHDLATLHQHSALLQHYSLDSGSIKIASKNGKKPYSFSADIPYRYPFLVKDDVPAAHLNITGGITEEGLRATVNDAIQIHYSDQLIITSKGVGLNIPVVVTFFKEHPRTAAVKPGKKKPLKYSFNATDSILFFRPGNKILADRMQIENVDSKLIMRLDHGSGFITLDLEGDNFSLKGKNLDHTFMSALAGEAQFENGQMSIAAKGMSDKFSALFKLEDTILKKMKSLQNILAFANTIPALITFSLPEYNSRGLPLSSAVVGMTFEGGMATIESFTMESPEINITGNGWINFPQNKIDMDFNLVTQASTNIKKIPLAGYVLTGDEKRPSITVKVSGDLRDPKVENSMMKEVVTLPFKILLRTLALPFHLVDSMAGPAEDKQDKESPNIKGEK